MIPCWNNETRLITEDEPCLSVRHEDTGSVLYRLRRGTDGHWPMSQTFSASMYSDSEGAIARLQYAGSGPGRSVVPGNALSFSIRRADMFVFAPPLAEEDPGLNIFHFQEMGIVIMFLPEVLGENHPGLIYAYICTTCSAVRCSKPRLVCKPFPRTGKTMGHKNSALKYYCSLRVPDQRFGTGTCRLQQHTPSVTDMIRKNRDT